MEEAAKMMTLRRCEKRKSTATSCGDQKRLARLATKKDDHEQPYLPDEVIFENILTRVPVSTLMRCCCVSKHWYKSILDDPHFEISYLAHQSSKKDLPFVFYNLNVPKDRKKGSSSKFPNRNYIFRLEEEKDYDYPPGDYFDILCVDEKLLLKSQRIRLELVGNCNGLVCLYRSWGSILIVSPNRPKELLTIYKPPILKYGRGYVCCYGFVFDSFTHEYKVVIIVRTIVNKSEFKCLVFTLGINSWRETSTTIPVSAMTTIFYESAIFCGGALFWRTKSSSFDNNMMLLSFDVHDEEFQVIQLPAECASSSSLLEPEHQIIDPLLEFKGSPCVARLEKAKLGGGAGMCSSTSTSNDDQNTSYCYKVHLHILKEYSKVGLSNEQAWIKETFDIAPHSFTNLLSPAAPCFLTSGTATFRAPPNRIMSSSDGRVFLYCFRAGQVVQIYDLQTKRLKIANCGMIFHTKKHSEVYNEIDNEIDYHLNGSHIENFMSMLAFIPKGGGGGAPPRLDRDEFRRILDDKQRPRPLVGYLSIRHKKSADIYLL